MYMIMYHACASANDILFSLENNKENGSEASVYINSVLLLGVCGPVGLVYSSIIHPLMLSHGIQRCFSNFSSYPRTKLKAKNNPLISFFFVCH